MIHKYLCLTTTLTWESHIIIIWLVGGVINNVTILWTYILLLFISYGCLVWSSWDHENNTEYGQFRGSVFFFIIFTNAVFYSNYTIGHFHSGGRHLCKFVGTKESVCIRKEFNSHRIGLEHQHGCRFIVLGHQYGSLNIMWKHSILLICQLTCWLTWSTCWLMLSNIDQDLVKILTECEPTCRLSGAFSAQDTRTVWSNALFVCSQL